MPISVASLTPNPSFTTCEGVATDDAYVYVSDNSGIIHKVNISSGAISDFVAAQTGDPQGIVIHQGYMYVAYYGGPVGKINMSTLAATYLGNVGSGVLVGMTTDGAYLYITGPHCIIRMDMTTGTSIIFAGGAWAPGSVDGVGTDARFNSPYDVIHIDGFLYVADTGNHKIRKIDTATAAVTTFAGSGAAGTLDGTGINAEFSSPKGITKNYSSLYLSDALYVTEAGSAHIRQVTIPGAVVSFVAGSTVGYLDGAAADAKFSSPFGITMGGAYLYVADTGNSRIRSVGPMPLNPYLPSISFETPETNMGVANRLKLAREIRMMVQGTSGTAGETTVGSVEFYCDRVLKFTGTLTTDGTGVFRLDRFRLPPLCRGESFHMKFISAAGKTMEIRMPIISEFVLLPQGTA